MSVSVHKRNATSIGRAQQIRFNHSEAIYYTYLQLLLYFNLNINTFL